MKYKYIIFYSFMNGSGHCDIINDTKIKSVDDLKIIEDMISKDIKANVVITNYKKTGMAWK